MTEAPTHTEKGQIERAQRIRQQIERLKSGSLKDERPEEEKSLREKVEERSARRKKKS